MAPMAPGRIALGPLDRSRPAPRQVFASIRRAIIALELKPNQSISENEVATALEISRTPVREAFIRLIEEGLLVSFPQIGTFIAPISLRGLHQAQFLREAVECACTEQAARRCDVEAAAELALSMQRHREAHASGDLAAFHRCDEDMHRMICDISGFPDIWPTIVETRGHLDRVRQLDLPDTGAAMEVLEQHAGIIEAISANDAAIATKRMRRHLRRVLDRLDIVEKHHPDFFKLKIPQRRRTA